MQYFPIIQHSAEKVQAQKRGTAAWPRPCAGIGLKNLQSSLRLRRGRGCVTLDMQPTGCRGRKSRNTERKETLWIKQRSHASTSWPTRPKPARSRRRNRPSGRPCARNTWTRCGPACGHRWTASSLWSRTVPAMAWANPGPKKRTDRVLVFYTGFAIMYAAADPGQIARKRLYAQP